MEYLFMKHSDRRARAIAVAKASDERNALLWRTATLGLGACCALFAVAAFAFFG